MGLQFDDSNVVHLDTNTFMWIQLSHYSFDEPKTDASLLAALIASDSYNHDYASPFEDDGHAAEPAVHGRWWRSSIRTEHFVKTSAESAESLLETWAHEQDWVDPQFQQSSPTRERLRQVYALFRSGDVFHLTNPDTDDEHPYGFVTGDLGFHEFIVIDREASILSVVVASDD